MPPKLHYYLRFLLGLTRWEMYGIACLMGLVIGVVVVREVISKKDEVRSKKEEVRRGGPVAEALETRQGGRISSPVAEALEASGYDTAFLNEVIRVTKVNKVTRVNKVYGGYWVGASNWKRKTEASLGRTWKNTSTWKPMPEALEGRGRLSKPQAININTADSLEWIGLKGIGPGFAHRILVFREKLGGFYAVEQLKEVYGLDSLWVKENRKLLLLGKGIYRKFKVNTLDWKHFRHPYLPYDQAKIVLKYRAQHGAFKDFEQLKAVTLINLTVWSRMKPYLDFVEIE